MVRVVRNGRRSAFTLIELLVVVTIISLLAGFLLPALGSTRESGRSTICLANLRQIGLTCRQYADDNRGVSPAIGQPYASWPTWALVVQTYSGRDGETPGELYTRSSVLVCPTIAAHYRVEDMVRTYAMNATGHAGLPGDRGNYDDEAHPAFVRLDAVQFPSHTPLFMDSDVPPAGTSNPPPPTRTAAMLDFRQPEHVDTRLGRFHSKLFNASMVDLSARTHRKVRSEWVIRLP